jgi:cell division protein FtsA
MAQKEHLLAAVDIGTTKIVSIVGKLTENKKLEILGMSKTASKGVKRGVVQNIEETVNAINTTVIEVKKQTGISFNDVFVGIAGQHIKSVRNRGYFNRDSYDEEITKADIQRLVDDMYKIPIDAGEEIIHVLPQSFVVDSETGIKNPVGISGRRLEGNFHIVIGQIASAKNISKCINRVGLRVEDLILEPLASSEAVLTEDEKEAGVVLVDIGGGTTDIAVFYDDTIRHTAVIPFGGNVVTNDIKEGCSILKRQAESLKITFGSALGDLAQEDKIVTIPGISGRDPKEISFKSLAYIIQSRMEEIIDAVMFEVDNSGVIDKLSAGIVFTGGGALLRHLPQLVKFRTGLDVRIGYPVEQLAAESIEEVNQPMYSTSVGLLLKGYDNQQNQKDLIHGTGEDKLKPGLDPNDPDKQNDPSVSVNQDEEKPGLITSLKVKIADLFKENDPTYGE